MLLGPEDDKRKNVRRDSLFALQDDAVGDALGQFAFDHPFGRPSSSRSRHVASPLSVGDVPTSASGRRCVFRMIPIVREAELVLDAVISVENAEPN